METLTKEITGRYSIENETFKLGTVQNAELDNIGESKDEINFSVRLKDEDTINTATVSIEKDRIIWDKGNIKIENYSFDEGYKFVLAVTMLIILF